MSDSSFSDYRESGVLSDFTVVVDSKEFKLHKFPLYTKSDFFRDVVREKKDEVELHEFPGGAEVFEIVADFCYNVDFNLNDDNAIPLRCAAEYLQMRRGISLADVTDRYIRDTLTTARMKRTVDVIAEMLKKCSKFGNKAEDAGIVSMCIDACVDVWLKQKCAKYTAWNLSSSDSGLNGLSNLPLDWFLRLLTTARERDVKPTVLVELVQHYMTQSVKEYDMCGDSVSDDPRGVGLHEQGGHLSKTIPADSGVKNNTNGEGVGDRMSDEAKQETFQDTEKDTDESGTRVNDAKETSMRKQKLAETIDTLLGELPENAHLSTSVTPEWLTGMVKITSELGCRKRSVLLQAAAGILHRLSATDLASLPPSTVRDAIQEKLNQPSGVKNTAALCQIVDSYLQGVASQGRLDTDTFVMLMDAVPMAERDSCDVLLEVVQLMITTEKNLEQNDKVQKWKRILESIDNSKIHEDTLKSVYQSDVIPSSFVTESALALCIRLRRELSDAKVVIQMQETDIRQRSNNNRSFSTSPSETISPRSGKATWKTAHRKPYRPRASPSAAKSSTETTLFGRCDSDTDDLELKMALWRVDDNFRK